MSARRWLLALACVGALAACERGPASGPVPAPASAASAGPARWADTDQAEALMRAVPGWASAQQPVAAWVDGGPAVLAPGLVVPLSADTRLLLVRVDAVDDQGQSLAGHATAGVFELHRFERGASGWRYAGRAGAPVEAGFSGQVGELALSPAGTSPPVLLQEAGSCWQGYCGSWLQLYALGVDGAKPQLPQAVMTSSSNEGAQPGCEEAGAEAGEKPAAGDGPARWSVLSRWQWAVAPGQTAPALVLQYEGEERDTACGAPRPVRAEVRLLPAGGAYTVQGTVPARPF
ncbi:hypothetical protein [Inhella crocodyli]|uniref:Lipoprotein n=1 Tax=Inhella crocodyli TaxID=2499851 RepID=A0A437LEP1_9BURK|nr:hypothetical protein [Inhella crocodyli]RVT83759.1 hypothetical protein EOD73_14420 [Inhella crocodyli]